MLALVITLTYEILQARPDIAQLNRLIDSSNNSFVNRLRSVIISYSSCSVNSNATQSFSMFATKNFRIIDLTAAP